MSKQTDLIHHGYRAPEGFAAPAPAVHKASTVFFPNCKALREHDWLHRTHYTYGLHGTPTSYELEARLAQLEGGSFTLLTPSGLNAIALVNQALLQAGDRVLLPDNVYGPSRALARHELQRAGVAHAVYDPLDPASLPLDARVKLVWLEAAGSVTPEFPDLLGLIARIRAEAPQAVIALDNTWGAGLAFDAFALAPGVGVDLTIHALTKYPSGGGDVLMGSVISRDEALHARLAHCHSRLGIGVGMNDVELVLRSLPTLTLRYAAHDRAARAVAQWAQQQPWVKGLLHPPTPGSPGHAHWKALCHDQAAGLLSLRVDGDAEAFIDALRVFRIGWSWGGPNSLAVPYQLSEIRQAGQGAVVRLAIGLEDPADLIADLAQAAAAVF